MADQQHGSGSGEGDLAKSGLQDFQFTFTARPGAKGFIEPDVSRCHLRNPPIMC